MEKEWLDYVGLDKIHAVFKFKFKVAIAICGFEPFQTSKSIDRSFG